MRKKDRQQYADLTDGQIALLYREGDNLALEYLMFKYERYIHKVASGYYWRTNLDNDDILAEARVGFMEGVYRYDAEGYFMYFTGMWMKASIFLSIDNNSRLIRIPINRLKDMRKIDSILTKSTDEYYTSEDISIQTGIHIDKVEKYLFTSNDIIDINPFFNIEDSDSLNILKLFDDSDLAHDLKRIIDQLSPTEHYIMTRLYGLFGNIKMGNDTIGEELNISNERVRQIKDRCLRRFRHHSFSSILQQYLN